MKNIGASREWYQSKKEHCDRLIKNIVLGNKGDGESKEVRSELEERFIDDLETLRGYVDRLEDPVNLLSRLKEATRVLNIVADWGLENNDDI